MIGASLLAAAWAAGLLLAGAKLTVVGPWYRGLRKAAWQPPDWLFGPVWVVVLGLSAWSGVLGLQAGAAPGVLLAAFAVNGVLHFLWSPLFFKVRRPDWALVEVPFLWLSVLGLILVLAPVSAFAAWLNAPYLAWVSYAVTLNWAVVRLNPPFRAAVAGA